MEPTSTHGRHPQSGAPTAADFFERNGRNLGYAGIGLVVLAAGGWFFLRSKGLKEERAEQAYRGAMQSVMSGNAPLAQSDLKKLTLRYKGTVAGTEGAMALAKLQYSEGKYKEGIESLKAAEPGTDMAYDVHTLIAAGHEGLNAPTEAAKEYEIAASSARFDADKDVAHANAARAYQLAGQRDAALKIWTELGKNPDSPASAEARVRIGELEAKAVKI